MKAKDRRACLEYIAKQFHDRHPDWTRLKNPPDLPYYAIFFAREVLPQCRVFVGFYNSRGVRVSFTVGWLSQDWHPRTQELVARYLSERGSLAQIRKLGGTPDFDHADFERSLGALLPVNLYEHKTYEATLETCETVARVAISDIETEGFEYLDLMLRCRHNIGLPADM